MGPAAGYDPEANKKQRQKKGGRGIKGGEQKGRNQKRGGGDRGEGRREREGEEGGGGGGWVGNEKWRAMDGTVRAANLL